jgi:hypothetical protein
MDVKKYGMQEAFVYALKVELSVIAKALISLNRYFKILE